MKILLTTLLFISFLPSCKNKEEQSGNDSAIIENSLNTKFKSASADLTGKNNSTLSGIATFSESGDGAVTMLLEISDIQPGTYGVHLHEFGNCNSNDGSSAGGHWNPLNHEHGERGKGEFHAGDVGNIVVDETREGMLEIVAPDWMIGGNDSSKNILHKALIIHAGEDDFLSQPSGNAGARIACGIIRLDED